MKPVAADLLPFGQSAVDGVGRSRGWLAVEERRVEYRYAWNIRKQLSRHLNSFDRGRIVQRSQLRQLLESIPESGSSSWNLSDDEPELITGTGRFGRLALLAITDNLCLDRGDGNRVHDVFDQRTRDRSFTGLLNPCSTGPIAIAPALRCTAL